MKHKTVLLQETIEGLNIKDNQVYVDMTLGQGGHTEAICESASNLTLVGLDLDEEAIRNSAQRLESSKCKTIFENLGNDHVDEVLSKHGIENVDGFVFDLGFSSDQLEDGGKGLSFQKDEPLIMTLGREESIGLNAYKIVNHFSLEQIQTILEGYGDEKYAYKISKAIVKAREQKEIKTTTDLTEIIEKGVPPFYRYRKIHPATKTFQALRIAVNDEIERLRVALVKSFNLLQTGGRIAVISFHSIEDRIVKRYFRELVDQGLAKKITKKPITASEEELAENPRARSAKLRIIEKI